MATTPAQIAAAKQNGIVIPTRAARAADDAGIPYAVACAILEQESGGGQMIWGHDPGWFSGAGAVTKANYAIYKRGRQAGKGSQGCGPCQLTYAGYQDQADALGGCWRVMPNLMVGFGIIADYVKQGLTLHQAFARYNGSEAYAAQMDDRVTKWSGILHGA